jgi:hypothetical protein
MRVRSDSLLELPKALVRQELGDLWVMPRELGWLADPAASAAPHVETCFTDSTFETPAAVDGGKRVRFGCKSGTSFFVAGLVAPALPRSGLVLFLTTERDVLVAIRTYLALGSDGVLHDPGHEVGITLLTAERLLAQRGRRLLHGEALGALSLEVKDESGAWNTAVVRLSIPADVTVSVERD